VERTKAGSAALIVTGTAVTGNVNDMTEAAIYTKSALRPME